MVLFKEKRLKKVSLLEKVKTFKDISHRCFSDNIYPLFLIPLENMVITGVHDNKGGVALVS